MHAKLFNELGEDVELRLVHSAAAITSLCITISVQDLPGARVHRRNS